MGIWKREKQLKNFSRILICHLEVTYQEKRLNLQYRHLKSRYRRNQTLKVTGMTLTEILYMTHGFAPLVALAMKLIMTTTTIVRHVDRR
nr:MAG TPA: hypothetical protein [Caudoviricetes sp.]